MGWGRLITGDCVRAMSRLGGESVDLVVTSPPYGDLRAYEGYQFDFEATVAQLFRVISIGGVVVWVVNDVTKTGSECGTSFKQALHFKQVGFNLHDTMIYAKRNPTPYHHNRYNPCFEFMFVFSKGKPKTFNPIRVKTKGYAPKRCPTFRYPDGSLKRPNSQKMNSSKMRNNIFYYTVGLDRGFGEHPAKFPIDLARDQIRSWSQEGDLVLDPMCGSGTTLLAAKELNRRYIGIDISPKYIALSKRRLGWREGDA